MATYRAQAHIDASLEEVWALVGNPATYPEWWPVAVEIRGERFELGDPFTQVLEIAGRNRPLTGYATRWRRPRGARRAPPLPQDARSAIQAAMPIE